MKNFLPRYNIYDYDIQYIKIFYRYLKKDISEDKIRVLYYYLYCYQNHI